MQTALVRGVLHSNLKAFTLCGPVIKGFGRGSSQLGCPTANIPIDPYRDALKLIENGVYWGLASVAGGPVYACALNVGWSPYFKNQEKTIEIHVIAKMDDFYGSEIRAVALGYIRPEADFNSLDSLKTAIADDIEYAKTQCAQSKEANNWRTSDFLCWRERNE